MICGYTLHLDAGVVARPEPKCTPSWNRMRYQIRRFIPGLGYHVTNNLSDWYGCIELMRRQGLLVLSTIQPFHHGAAHYRLGGEVMH